MKIGPRTRRRGRVSKIQARKAETVARMRAGPPLPARFAPRPGAAEALVGPERTTLASGDDGSPIGRASFVATDAELGGSYDDLSEARERTETDAPNARVFSVDFVIHPIQLERAAASGADGVLLVARIVSEAALVDLVARARALGLEPLVEVASEDELQRAISLAVAAVAVAVRDRDHGRVEVARAFDLARAARASGLTCVALDVPDDPDAAPLDSTFQVLVREAPRGPV